MGHNKDWLEPNESTMVEDLTSSRPWASVFAHCNTLAKQYIHKSHESYEKWKLLSRVWLFATPWTIQSMEFSGPEYWSG